METLDTLVILVAVTLDTLAIQDIQVTLDTLATLDTLVTLDTLATLEALVLTRTEDHVILPELIAELVEM